MTDNWPGQLEAYERSFDEDHEPTVEDKLAALDRLSELLDQRWGWLDVGLGIAAALGAIAYYAVIWWWF